MTFSETREIVYAVLAENGHDSAKRILLRRNEDDRAFSHAMARHGVGIFQELIDAQYATVH